MPTQKANAHVPTQTGSDDLILRFQNVMRDANMRMTRQRQAILDVLASTTNHPDIHEIYQRASKIDPTVALSTVYRTMAVLETHGVIQRLNFDGQTARYESTLSPHHDHLIDVDTGEVVEFHSELIEALQKEITEEHGYELISHKLELYARKIR